MKIIQNLLILFLVYLTTALEWFEQNNPHFVDDTQLTNLLMNEHSTIKVVKFFTPWCRYCRFMKSNFETYKSSHQIHPNLKFYQFNCAHDERSCGLKYRVRGYPHIAIYGKNGKQIQQMGGMYPQNVVYQFLDKANEQAKKLGQTLQQQHKKQTEKIDSQKVGQNTNIQKSINNQINKDEQKAQNKPQKQQIPQKKAQITDTISIQKEELVYEQINQQNNTQKSNISISNIMKYLFYFLTAMVGTYYGLSVFWHKYENTPSHTEQTQKFIEKVEIQPSQTLTQNFAQDQQIKVQDVQDQNL